MPIVLNRSLMAKNQLFSFSIVFVKLQVVKHRNLVENVVPKLSYDFCT